MICGLALLTRERTPGDVVLGGWGTVAAAGPAGCPGVATSTAQPLPSGVPRDAGNLFVGATIHPGFVAGGSTAQVSEPARRHEGTAGGMFDDDFLNCQRSRETDPPPIIRI